MKRKSLERSVKIREDFTDRPHRRKQVPGWHWPTKMVEVGDCEAVMYRSDKWQKDGRKIDYKHVKEGPQKVLVTPNMGTKGDFSELYGPYVDLRGELPDSFAVLAECLSIQARLYSNHEGTKYSGYADMKFPRSKLGAGTFDDGTTFLVVYNSQGVLALVVGEKLEVLKDGIVG